MKIPKEYEGKLVGLSLVRPVHMFEYGAHVKMGNDELITPAPVMKTMQTPDGQVQSPSMTDLIMGAFVVHIDDDEITILLYVPEPDGKSGVVMRKCLSSALVLSIDAVDEYDAPMPPVRREVRHQVSTITAPSVLLK